jgi:hypothetical protein
MNKVERAASGHTGLAPLELTVPAQPALCLAQAAEWAVRVIAEARYATRHAAEFGRHHDTGTFTRSTATGTVAGSEPMAFSRLLEQFSGC